MSAFKCTSIHPYNPDAISPLVYAPNDKFKGCVIDANEGVNKREEENNEDEDNNQDNNDNDDNDDIDMNTIFKGNVGMEMKTTLQIQIMYYLLLRHYKRVE